MKPHRAGLLLALIGALLPSALPAHEPAEKPPWQRLLQEEDARTAVTLRKQLAQLQVAGKLEDALKVAEELAQLRGKVQGSDHWQSVYARWQVTALRKVLAQGQETGSVYVRALVLADQADSLRRKGHYKEAQSLLQKVLTLHGQVLGEEHPYTATSHNNLALILSAQGKYSLAEEGYRKALAVRRKVFGEEDPATATSYNNLAGNQEAQGRYAQAEQGYRKALAIRQKVLGEEHPDTAQSYNNLAYTQNAQGRYAQAEEGYRTALSIYRKVLGENHPHTATSYNNLAANQNDQGKYTQAEEGYRRALAIYRKVLGEEHPSMAQSYNNLAVNQHDQGKYTQAEEACRKALAIYRKVLGEEHPDTAQSYNSLASIQKAQGKYAQAEGGFRKALAINQKVLGEEHPRTALSYNNLASNQNVQGKYAQAEEGFRKALAIWSKLLGEEHPYTAASHNNLALILNAQGKYGLAEEACRKALVIRRKVLGEEHPDTATSYHNLAANQNAQGKYALGEEGCRKALAINRKVLGEEHPRTVLSYNNLAANQNAQGKYAQAEKLWCTAAESFTRARLGLASSGLERATRTSESSPLPCLAAVLARNGKPEQAWQRFEESLARGTWDDLSARLRRPAAEQARQVEIVTRLNRLDQLIERTLSAREDTPLRNKRRTDLLTQRRQLQEELDAFAHHLEETYGPAAGQVFERAQIQKSLPADTALLAWLDVPGQASAADPNGEHWAVLLRSSGNPVWMRLPGSGGKHAWTDADSQLPAQLRAALQSASGPWHPLARRLGQQRLAPLAKHLDGVGRLVMLPSPALAGVPVEVFAEGYTVSYAPSGTLHAHLQQSRKTNNSGLLTLANPVFEAAANDERSASRGEDGGKWPPLPGTRAEAEALSRLFERKSPPKLLLDSEASEQRLYELAQSGDLGKYRYVHLATHGEVDNTFPLRSAVILSRDQLPDPGKQLEAGLPVYDGRLTAEEVLRQWHLDSELVTLSACQTALGKYERGEGFVGFAQALILAGSRSVCLSLWKVDDTATALLMQRFYQNLLGKREGLEAPLSKAQALAEAKEWLRQLSRDEAGKYVAQLSADVDRGKGRKVQPLLPELPAARDKQERPYAHPYYWAAFVLIGQPE